MQPYLRAPDLVWPGHLHGTSCFSARAMDTGFPTVVWRSCLGPGCASARVPVTPPFLVGALGCVCVRACGPLPPGGSVCVCVGLGFVCSPVFSWLGCWVAWPLVCAASVSRNLQGGAPVAWRCAGVAVGGVCPPPSPFVYFFGLRGWMVFGPVVSWLCGVPVLCLVVSVPPSPLIRVAPSRFFLPVSAPARYVLASAGCPFFWWTSALGLVPPVLAGWSSVVPSGGPLGAVFGAVWLQGLPASCGVGGRLRGCGPISCPPTFPFFGGGSACSSLCLPWAGARTCRHLLWLTRLPLVLAFCWALPRPYGSGELCTRLARWPFLWG